MVSRHLLLLILLLYETAVLEQWVHIIVAHTPDRCVACRDESWSDSRYSSPAPNRCRCHDKCPIFIAVMVVGISAVMPCGACYDDLMAAAQTTLPHLLVPSQQNVSLFYQRAPPPI